MNLQTADLPLAKPFPAWRWKDLLLILFGIGVVLVVGGVAYSLVLLDQGVDLRASIPPTVSLSIALASLESAALIGCVYFIGMRRRNVSWLEMGLRPVSTGWLIATLFLTGIAIPITGLITLLVMLALGLPLENPQIEFLLPEGLSASQALIMFFLVGLAVPFAEELLFRGVLYPLLRQRWGVWVAVVLSSILFGLVHGEIAIGLTAFMLGILLASVYEFSGSLWTSILIHAVNNGSKIALLYLLIKLGYQV
jgi:uncharacterized protein